MQIRYVNTASSAGGDGTTNNTSGSTRAYATLKEALDAIGASLSDAMTIYCEGSAADTGSVNQSTWDFTTTAANYLLITTTAANRHSGKWDTGKYRITATNANGLYQNTPCHVRIDGLQVEVTVSDAGSYECFKSSNANQTAGDCYLTISNCIAKAVISSGSVIGYNPRPFGAGGAGFAAIWNCIAIDCTSGFSSDMPGFPFYNCGAYDCTFGFVSDAVVIAKNCLSKGATTGFVSTFAAVSSHNAEDDGNGAPGSKGRSGVTFTFVDAANDDFHLSTSDAGAKWYGTQLPGGALFSNDVDGVERVGLWDIGPDQQANVRAGPALNKSRNTSFPPVRGAGSIR